MKKIVAKLFITILLLSLIACGGGSDTSGSCDLLNARIFGGESCNQNSRSSVVFLEAFVENNDSFEKVGNCTGTLVTIDDILTSAHCFSDVVLGLPGRNVVFTALVGGQNGERIPIINLALHPNYNGRAGSRFDVAMATIGSVPNPPVGPMPILISEITLGGSEITAFGYGTNNAGESGELKSADFAITSLSEGNLLVVGKGEQSICPGDSGGPAVYRTSQGVAALAGVNSFVVTEEDGSVCTDTAARTFGFVDIQYAPILNFISNYAPDIAIG